MYAKLAIKLEFILYINIKGRFVLWKVTEMVTADLEFNGDL